MVMVRLELELKFDQTREGAAAREGEFHVRDFIYYR